MAQDRCGSAWPLVGSALISRRGFTAGVIASAAASVAAQRPAPAAVFSTTAIDVHHHFLPPDYKPLARPWLDRYATGVADVIAWTPERSLAAMAAARVDHAVLSISAPGLSFGDAVRARATARDCNDYASTLGRDHSGRFSFFAALPMPDVDAAIREAERALALPGAVGVGLLTNYDGRYLGDTAFRPLFRWLAGRDTRVYVHPTTAPCCTGLTPDVPTPLIEFPVDTARAISSLLWSGVLSAAPRNCFIFSHGGGAMPMVMERVLAVGLLRPDLARLVPEGAPAALRRLYVDTASATARPAMAAMAAWLPPEHLLYGTDYPWGDLVRSRAALQQLGLPAERLAAIERGNAERLLASG